MTQGILCPNPTDNGYSQTICANSWSLDNYQIAVFGARARALSDNSYNAQYTGTAEPYMTSTNPSCTPNNFTWTTTPYFTDVPTSDTYFKYIQRWAIWGPTRAFIRRRPTQAAPIVRSAR